MIVADSEPYRACTRFNKCSVNNCPLHPGYPDLLSDPEDTEPKCTLPKSYRLKVAEMFPSVLKLGGMTPKEYSAKVAWESKTPEERARLISLGKKSLFVVHSTDKNDSAGVGEGAPA